MYMFNQHISVYKTEEGEAEVSYPQFAPVKPAPGEEKVRKSWLGYFAGGRKGK